MFDGFFGGDDGDAYNDQPVWFDDEPDEGDTSQAFDALESLGYDAFESAEMLDEAALSGVSAGELTELVDGVAGETGGW